MSLTSYQKRFDVLDTALKSLLTQRTRPDEVVLWIHRRDAPALPKRIRRLHRQGLTIRCVDADTRSYTKLVPALAEYEKCFIATADDDIVYPADWLTQLVNGIDLDRREVVGLRGRWIEELDPAASAPAFARYEGWRLVESSDGASERIVLTGVGGILYPPACFGQDVKNQELFLRICPTADDLWFYFQLRRNGYVCRKVGAMPPLEVVAGSQVESLWSANRAGENDACWARLVREFGNPLRREDAHAVAPDSTLGKRDPARSRPSAPAERP